MGNTAKYFVFVILNGIYAMMLAGSVLQTFMLEFGFSEEATNIFFSVMNIVQVLSILVLSGIADKVKRTKLWQSNTILAALPFAVCLVLMCFESFEASPSVSAFLYLLGFVYNVGVGINGVLAYKLPYSIMDMNDYGRISALSGCVAGVVSFGISALLSYVQVRFDYMNTMKIAYIASIGVLIASAIVMKSFKEKKIDIPVSQTSAKTNILRYKPFTYLIIPNITRGISLGMIGMAVTIGYYHGCVDSFSASIIVIITGAATIIGCLIYSKISGVIKDRRILLFSSIAVALFMPLMVLRNNTLDFLIFYAIAYFFVTIINYAVPVTVTKIADYSIISQYSAGRMLLNTLGISIAGFFCVAMFNLVGVVTTMIISGLLQLVSGVGYYLYLKYFLKLKNVRDI